MDLGKINEVQFSFTFGFKLKYFIFDVYIWFSLLVYNVSLDQDLGVMFLGSE